MKVAKYWKSTVAGRDWRWNFIWTK